MIHRIRSLPAKRLIPGLGSGICPRCVAQTVWDLSRVACHLLHIKNLGICELLNVVKCFRGQQEGHRTGASFVCTSAILFTSFKILIDTGCNTLKTMQRPTE